MKQERKRDAVWFGAAFGLVLLVALAFGLVQLFAGGWGEQASLPQELGLDGTLEKPAAFWDGHGGFHGDGTAYWEIAFSPEEAAALEKSLQGAHPVEEGYWFFYNKQTDSYTAAGALNQPSLNFTAAVYDSQSRTLYCGELDT